MIPYLAIVLGIVLEHLIESIWCMCQRVARVTDIYTAMRPIHCEAVVKRESFVNSFCGRSVVWQAISFSLDAVLALCVWNTRRDVEMVTNSSP